MTRSAPTAKQQIRERIWARMQSEGVARFPGARGRIPNFLGAEAAAARLAELSEWSASGVIKSNPDAAQLPVRRRAYKEHRTLYMAVPRLAEERPFVLVTGDPTIRRAMAEGHHLALGELERVDLIVCGTVAVNRDGVRIGKGGGFSDLEFALLAERGLVGDWTTIVTTVHRLQLVDEPLAETEHDFRVDVIVTPDEVVRTTRRRRPSGILWDPREDGGWTTSGSAPAGGARATLSDGCASVRRPPSSPSSRSRRREPASRWHRAPARSSTSPIPTPRALRARPIPA